jgi:hypothetical protein
MASGEQESDHPKSAAPECGKSMATGGDKEQVEKPSMIGNYELGRVDPLRTRSDSWFEQRGLFQ